MAYVITQNCCNDASCVAACPVGCIHPTPYEPGFGAAEMLHIDPATCIDCGACADACPVDAIRPDDLLGLGESAYRQINADYYRDHPLNPAFHRMPPLTPLVTAAESLRVAVVGSGPAGLYSAKELLRHPGVEVHMFERLGELGGLIGYGVAPDHPATKAVIQQFRFAGDKQRRFHPHLGVEIGRDLDHTELMADHHAVIYATGAFRSRLLDIPGTNLPGCFSAADIVGWYNGHPDHCGVIPRLTGRRAVVVGNGNVALDIARILLTDPSDLAGTSIAAGAALALSNSTIDEVAVVARRGPEHIACSVPELQALIDHPGIDVCLDPAELEGTTSATHRELAMLHALAGAPPKPSATRRITLQFRSTPTHVLGTRRTTGVRLDDGSHLDTDLLIQSIGFNGRRIPGVPFDDGSGPIPNVDGRVVETETGATVPGVYVTGWIKRGPSGVIGTNRTCAEETVAALLADHAAARLHRPRTAERVSVA